MIHGRHRSMLSVRDPMVLARWIALRTIVWNAYVATSESQIFFSAEQRAVFLASDLPLSNSLALLAPALPSVRVNFESGVFSLRPIASPYDTGIPFLETTCLIRQVALQSVIYSKDWVAANP